MKYAISFNGGKESLIVLHRNIEKIKNGEALVFRVKMENEFEEIEKYIEEVKNKYLFDIIEFTDMKECIESLKSRYNVEIIVLGVRRTDPNCSNCTVYQPTDKDWPYIMRYSPLLDWSYSDVWNYIDFHSLLICSLYEKGYTSIGTKHNTFPNYYLFNGKDFNHAKTLLEDKYEREGRIKNSLPFSFSGKVVRGKGLGKGLGFPTANLDVILNIDEGVYYGTCIKNRKEEKIVMSVGINPTFNDKSVEVHILKKYSEDFYDDILFVNVKGFIRKMNKYNSIEELISAINKDIKISEYLLV